MHTYIYVQAKIYTCTYTCMYTCKHTQAVHMYVHIRMHMRYLIGAHVASARGWCGETMALIN